MQNWLPLFPLPLVLLPGSDLPLHIFEERYRLMIGDVRRSHGEFGVVLASDQGMASIGCTATVESILQEYPDGRLDILTLGRRRFEIEELNEDMPYLRGSVDFFLDQASEPASSSIRERALQAYYTLRTLSNDDAGPAPDPQDSQLSFQIARPITDLNVRQALLSKRSEGDRLRQLADILPALIETRRQAEHLKQMAPRNGHGGKRPMIQ